MGIEGQLQVRLQLTDGAVAAVHIASNRPVHAASVLRGKSRANAQNVLPLLFSVCGTAQACACVRALEQARGVAVEDAAERIRQALVDGETLREHLWRILLDWPREFNQQPAYTAMVEVVALQREFTQAICLGGNAFAFGGLDGRGNPKALAALRKRLLRLLRREVFGEPVGTWLRLPDCDALSEWAARRATPAAGLIERVIGNAWQAAGACESLALPPMEASELERAMRDKHYVEQPHWRGKCCETTSLARSDSALLSDLRARFGNGLLPRLVGRLTEVAQLALQLPGRVLTPATPGVAAGLGVGQVCAARGRLAHRVQLDRHDRVDDYRILAPTEWNFHPNGVVKHALAVLQGGARQIEQQARLLITAIDPCVGYDLHMAVEG